MRILHLIDSAGIYGAEVMLLSLARESIRLGHDVEIGTIVSPNDSSNPLAELASNQGLRAVPFLMRDGIYVRGVGEIVRHVKDEKIDVVHSHGYKANVLMAIFADRSRHWATTCSLHGWTSCKLTDRRKVYEIIERRLISRIDYVVAVNEAIAGRVERSALAGRLEVIANGVSVHADSARPADHARERQGASLVLLAAGRLSREKGFDLLIEAIGMLRERGVIARLEIAGEGPERRNLEQQVGQLELGSLVKFLGYSRDMTALYENADCLVLSSRTEGLPMVVLEAMAHRLPVVATPVGDVPKVLMAGDLGFLADRSDARSIAMAIDRAASTSKRNRQHMADRAYERVRREYSVESSTRKYLSAYASAIARVQSKRTLGRTRTERGDQIE